MTSLMSTLVDDESTQLQNDQGNTITKTRMAKRKYHQMMICETKELAVKEVEQESIWSLRLTKESKEGRKMYYRCNLAAYRAKQCSAGLYILLHNHDLKASIYKTECEHDHVMRVESISSETKSEIIRLFALGITKPKSILENLRTEGKVPVPTVDALYNFLARHKKKLYGNGQFSLGTLLNWCETNDRVPLEPDQMFVVKYQVFLDIEEEQAVEDYELGDQFRFFISTPRLIRLTSSIQYVIQADGTYKLCWQGFPGLIVGTSDFNRTFHPFGFCLTSKEATNDYKFLFNAIQIGRQKLDLPILESDRYAIMADGAKSICNGFRNVFGDKIVRGMCWFHVKQQVDKRIKVIKCVTKRTEMISDIIALQLSQSPSIFQSASKLFVSKWEIDDDVDVKVFLDYFTSEWLNPSNGLHNWYEGYNHPNNQCSVSTNNGNESQNRVVKAEDTLRQLLNISQFLSVITNMVMKWSKDRDPSYVNVKVFALQPSLNLKLWTEGWNWKRQASEKRIIKRHSLFPNSYYFPNSENDCIIDDNVIETYESQMSSANWSSWHEFRNCAFGYWRVQIQPARVEVDGVEKDVVDWTRVSCTCPTFFKKYLCKHIVGVAICMKYTDAPALAKNVPIDRKRKVGRPCLARPALERFTFHSLIEADENENEHQEQRFDEVLANELAIVVNSTIVSTNQPILNIDDVNAMINTDLSAIPQVDFLDSVMPNIEMLTPDATNDGFSSLIAPVVDIAVNVAPVSNLLQIGSQANKRKKAGQPRKERSDKGKKRAKKN